jgi:hypothetical protein
MSGRLEWPGWKCRRRSSGCPENWTTSEGRLRGSERVARREPREGVPPSTCIARARALSARTRAFHHDLAARALAGGWLRLWLLELDGRPAAAWYGFRCGGREWYYQAGWDPAHARDAVGFVLLGHTVRAATQDGMTEYRFLRGREAFKERFGPRDDGLVTVGLARGPAGRAVLAAARAALRPRPQSPVGRAIRRLAGRAGWTGAS